jgi:hypothetical protein
VDAGTYDGGWISRCGDGWIDWSRGEVCDGSDLGGVTCASFGYHGGVLYCDPASCMTYIIDGCWYYY